MADFIIDIVLKNRSTRTAFTYDLENVHSGTNIKTYEHLPDIVSATVDGSKILDLINDSRCEAVDIVPESHEATLPAIVTTTKNIVTATPPTTQRGQDYMGLQFYVDNDQNNQSQTVGVSPKDDTSEINNLTYSSRWIGRNIDLVTIEGGGYDIDLSNQNVHNTHPDFTGGRFIPMDWSGTNSTGNNQISQNSMFRDHASAVLSVAAGNICGYAKGATCRASYVGFEGPAVMNSIIDFHTNKATNPSTGLKNPTIAIGEFQYLRDRKLGVPIDQVNEITVGDVSHVRPGSSWGNDYSKFVELNIVPFAVQDPDTSNYVWCVVLPDNRRYGTIFRSIKAMYDAGIIFINAAGNNGGVLNKNLTDSSFPDVATNVFVDPNYTLYDIEGDGTISKSTASTEGRYNAFTAFGPHGSIYAIDVAAGRNSEAHPGLDGYTNRGPLIDVIGLGANTWSAYQAGSNYTDGKWRHFSGTSCATPTVVGKVACYMERFLYYNERYPTFEEIKSWLTANGRDILVGISSVDWSSVPSAAAVGAGTYTSEDGPLLRIRGGSSTNGNIRFTDMVSTSRNRCHFRAPDDPTGTYSTTKRPVSGLMFPRQKIKQTHNYDVDDYPDNY